jgi:hypothetical protein
MNKALVKMLISNVGQETIEKAINELSSKLIEAKNSLKLEPDEDDAIIFLFADPENVIYATLATVNTIGETPAIKRQLMTWKVSELITTLIKNF